PADVPPWKRSGGRRLSYALERGHTRLQKILQRSQQERAKPTLLLVRAGQRVLLEQMSEKTLDEILGVSGRKTAVTKKTVKRWPIGFAKSGERLLSGLL